jgi:DinB superfamily
VESSALSHPDIRDLDEQLAAAERDASSLVAGLTEEQGAWRVTPDAWSIAECIDHLAVADRVYIEAMRKPAEQARQQGRLRRRPALPGLLGGWFVRSLEPPPKAGSKLKAPGKIRPRTAPPLADAFASFIASHRAARAFLREYSDLDLASVRFPNPFIRGIRFSLATGLHVITAHERRHLWQARGVRERLLHVERARA